MPIIRYDAPVRCLVAVRGHPFDRTGFDAVFQAMNGISATMVDQPAAALLMKPEAMRQSRSTGHRTRRCRATDRKH
ncbi:MAG TPA: hypothetical protein VE567_04790 [Sphingomonas sp.]|nr:hypothetical protein [Sphingomonas sp.]